MKAFGRVVVVVFVYLATSVAWVILGSVMSFRANDQKAQLETQVGDLWGRPQIQRAPTFELASQPAGGTATDTPNAWQGPARDMSGSPDLDAAAKNAPSMQAAAQPAQTLQPASSNIDVALSLDQRLKGLTWYSLYDVAFDGHFTYRHETQTADVLVVHFWFPDRGGVYDGFRLLVNGQPSTAQPSNGGVTLEIPVEPGDAVDLEIAYKSRGLDSWRYAPSDGAATLRDFHLAMHTNFDAIDFPAMTLSPSSKTASADGPVLRWDFEQVVSGFGIGMEMPQRIQPGQLAASLSYSAPISLLFFFLVLAVLARLRAIDIHPINYFFLGAAFFSFHLLFAYSVDHISVWLAFALSSALSIAMVVSYLRLVVSARFAVVHAGSAQLVYLVGFSLAHFASGFTGLTVTVLSIATLFLLMLLTGRIRWSEVLGRMSERERAERPIYPPHFVATYPGPAPYAQAAPQAPSPPPASDTKP